MSSEVAKKRGRPKKVISDPVEVEVPEGLKNATTRAKSTSIVNKTTKSAPTTPAKTSATKKTASKTAVASATSKLAPKATVASIKPVATATEKPAPTKSTPPTPTTSKILEEVKDMEGKKFSPPQGFANKIVVTGKSTIASAPESARKSERLGQEIALKKPADISKPEPVIAAEYDPVPQQQKPVLPPASSANPPYSPVKSTPPPLPSAKPTTKSYVPISELNSAIVSKITTRAGARPNTASSQQLPKNYKGVARKVTTAIVALPIAIVTSYVLYQRLVMGEEKKMLVPPQKPVDSEMKTDPPTALPTQ
ncbi:hypothetical protein WAI453_004695 [Rhynchosporium graminicola]